MTFSYQSFVVRPLFFFFSLSNDRFNGLLIVNSFQCESIFQKQNCHHQFSAKMFQRQFQLYLLVRKGLKFHNIGTNNVNCKAEWDHQSLTLKIMFGKQLNLLVTSSKPACICLLFPLICCMWKSGKGKLFCMQQRK